MGLVEELVEIMQVSQPPCASLLTEQRSALSHADTVHGQWTVFCFSEWCLFCPVNPDYFLQ